MTLIITFDLEHDLESSILFQKWILGVRIIWKSGITLLSRHISSKVAFFSVFDMLISYYAHKKSSPRLPSWQPSLISFNIPIESGSIIKPCTLKHFQVPILAPGLHCIPAVAIILTSPVLIGHKNDPCMNCMSRWREIVTSCVLASWRSLQWRHMSAVVYRITGNPNVCSAVCTGV